MRSASAKRRCGKSIPKTTSTTAPAIGGCPKGASSASGSDAPRRILGPLLQLFARPLGRLVLVTGRARVGHLQRIGLARRDEAERVAADHDVANRLLDRGHVAVDALVAG